MFKKYIVLILLMGKVLSSPVFCQEKIKPLAIGDTLPELPFHQVINYPKEKLKLSDFKGKLLILDFWNTWCMACLSSFPKLKALQEKYRDEVVIMPVVSYRGGDRQKYLDFYKMRSEIGMPIELPSIVEDSLLTQLFPYASLPHIVWIGQKGDIRGVTLGKELNEENLLSMLKSADFKLSHRDSLIKKYIDYSVESPMTVNIENGIIRKSQLGKNIPIKYSYNLSVHRDNNFTRVTAVNMRLPYILIQLFDQRFKSRFLKKNQLFAEKNIICETSNEPIASIIKFHNNTDQDKYIKAPGEAYSYELLLDGYVGDDKLFEAMHNDLNVTLGINAQLEKRKMVIYELYVRDRQKIKYTKFKNDRGFLEYETKDEEQRMVCGNSSLEAIVKSMNANLNIPFIWNVTNIVEPVNLDISWRKKHILKDLDRELSNYGLGLRKKKEKIEVLVLR